MPDPAIVACAVAAAVVVTAALRLAAARVRRPESAAALGALAVAAAFTAGAVVVGWRPGTALAGVTDRLSLVALPLAVAVEALVPRLARGRWRAAARAAAALGVVAAVLAGHVDFRAGAWRRLATLAAPATLLAAQWAGLGALAERRAAGAAHLTLASGALAAGVATMLTGYVSAGLAGLPLAAALATAAFVGRRGGADGASVGMGVVCLAGVIIAGHFFGSLPPGMALATALSPAVVWFAVWPRDTRLSGAVRATAVVLVAAMIAAAVMWRARTRFEERSSSAGAAPHPTARDYLDYGR